MQDINPQDGFPNPDFPTATSDEVEAARQSVLNAFNDVAQIFAGRGVMKNLAVMFQADPLSAEVAFRDDFFQPKFSSWSLMPASFGWCFNAKSIR